MPDFGDEMGSSLGRVSGSVFRYLLQQLHNGNYRRNVEESAAEDAVQQRQTVCTVEFDTEQERNAVADELRKHNIKVDAITVQKPAISFYQSDITKIQTVMEDRIKSHDGMDVDPFTAVKESVTPVQESAGDFSWKEDIHVRVAEARAGAADEKSFIKRCEERGLTVDRATDGELMFIHPGQGYWKVRGDTLGEKYSRHSFEHKPVRLEQEAKDMREASKALSAEKELLNRDRDIPNLQSLSK